MGEILDEQTLKELEAIPETTVEEFRLGAVAYEIGIALLKEEYPLLVDEEEN